MLHKPFCFGVTTPFLSTIAIFSSLLSHSRFSDKLSGEVYTLNFLLLNSVKVYCDVSIFNMLSLSFTTLTLTKAYSFPILTLTLVSPSFSAWIIPLSLTVTILSLLDENCGTKFSCKSLLYLYSKLMLIDSPFFIIISELSRVISTTYLLYNAK